MGPTGPTGSSGFLSSTQRVIQGDLPPPQMPHIPQEIFGRLIKGIPLDFHDFIEGSFSCPLTLGAQNPEETLAPPIEGCATNFLRDGDNDVYIIYTGLSLCIYPHLIHIY